ncbi:hypothetical protein ACQ4PT_022868 [Festuca glaucescens]
MEVTAGGEQHVSWSNLSDVVGRGLFINCFVRLSRSYYGSVACLNRDFNSLCSGSLEWVAYDPYRARWIQVPRMPPDECFMCSDKESLAVGTELLVFAMTDMVFRYTILTNSWTRADPMDSPRCLFGSTSVGGKAYVAGGTDSSGRVLSSAEMYDSNTHTWTTLASMNMARKMCSGVFMDGKFYVIGGVTNNNKVLTCGEEYDLNRLSWRVIENMSGHSTLECSVFLRSLQLSTMSFMLLITVRMV